MGVVSDVVGLICLHFLRERCPMQIALPFNPRALSVYDTPRCMPMTTHLLPQQPANDQLSYFLGRRLMAAIARLCPSLDFFESNSGACFIFERERGGAVSRPSIHTSVQHNWQPKTRFIFSFFASSSSSSSCSPFSPPNVPLFIIWSKDSFFSLSLSLVLSVCVCVLLLLLLLGPLLRGSLVSCHDAARRTHLSPAHFLSTWHSPLPPPVQKKPPTDPNTFSTAKTGEMFIHFRYLLASVGRLFLLLRLLRPHPLDSTASFQFGKFV